MTYDVRPVSELRKLREQATCNKQRVQLVLAGICRLASDIAEQGGWQMQLNLSKIGKKGDPITQKINDLIEWQIVSPPDFAVDGFAINFKEQQAVIAALENQGGYFYDRKKRRLQF